MHPDPSEVRGGDPSPFEPPGVRWNSVSPRLATLRRLVAFAIGLPLSVLALLVAANSTSPTMVILLGVALTALLIWEWIFIGRRVRAWGYAQREDDLLIRSGLMFRELIVVPYGRMQFVDVTSGPLERRFGLAGVRLYTAASRTAFLPGLVADEAARLRDELASKGEAQAAGL